MTADGLDDITPPRSNDEADTPWKSSLDRHILRSTYNISPTLETMK